MRLARMATIGCMIILVGLIIYTFKNNDQGKVTDRRQGVMCANSKSCTPTYSLRINDRWHPVSATTYRRCDIGEQHPACKHKR